MNPILQTIVTRGQLDAMLEDSMVLYRDIMRDLLATCEQPVTPATINRMVYLHGLRMDVEEIAAEYINERISLIGVV